jgi:hypothetical protein
MRSWSPSFWSLVLVGPLAAGPPARLPLPPDVTALDSPAGKKLLAEAEATAFYRMIEFSAPQAYKTHCGPATAALCLNFVGIAPPREGAAPALFNQADFIQNPAVRAALPAGAYPKAGPPLPAGMTLGELAASMRAFGADVEERPASTGSESTFRDDVRAAVRGQRSAIAVNFDRARVTPGGGGGHHSVLAAFHEQSDRVLLLDTAPYKYGFTWLRVGDLFRAMTGSDDASKKSRGYLIVTKP